MKRILDAGCRLAAAVVVLAATSPATAADPPASTPAPAASPAPAKEPAGKEPAAKGEQGDTSGKAKKKARRDPGINQPGPAGNRGPTPGPAGNAGPGR
jgi:hypothetical protein